MNGYISAEMYQKVQKLAALVKKQQQERHERDYTYGADLIEIEIIPGRKYTKIDYGEMPHMHGFLMVEHATGDIWGIKGYGRVHTGHKYGNLDTIDQWFWGNYAPERRTEQ